MAFVYVGIMEGLLLSNNGLIITGLMLSKYHDVVTLCQ